MVLASQLVFVSGRPCRHSSRARWRPAMFANWLDLFEAATAADFFVPEVASRFASAAHRWKA